MYSILWSSDSLQNCVIGWCMLLEPCLRQWLCIRRRKSCHVLSIIVVNSYYSFLCREASCIILIGAVGVIKFSNLLLFVHLMSLTLWAKNICSNLLWKLDRIGAIDVLSFVFGFDFPVVNEERSLWFMGFSPIARDY